MCSPWTTILWVGAAAAWMTGAFLAWQRNTSSRTVLRVLVLGERALIWTQGSIWRCRHDRVWVASICGPRPEGPCLLCPLGYSSRCWAQNSGNSDRPGCIPSPVAGQSGTRQLEISSCTSLIADAAHVDVRATDIDNVHSKCNNYNCFPPSFAGGKLSSSQNQDTMAHRGPEGPAIPCDKDFFFPS